MGWSLAFLEQMSRADVTAFYLLESVAVPDGIVNAFGGEIRLSSFRTAGYQAIMRKGSISFGELRVRQWAASQMTWSIGLVGDDAAGAVRVGIRRGQVLQLRVGFSRDLSTFETVAIGTVYNIERKGGNWSIVVRDLTGALIARFTEDPAEAPLFHDLASTLVATAYTPGDSEIHVGDISGFRDDGGGVGAIKITPDAGDDFFLTYTGTVPGPGAGLPKFTGLSSTGAFDTVAGAAAGGKAVTEVAYIKGTPFDIIRKILVSTGNGTNGAADVLPASWGFGIPEAFVARDDMTGFETEINVTGSDAQEFVAIEPASNAKSVLDAWLNQAGYFLAQHQGQITCRAALDPAAHRSPGHLDIVNRDIQALDLYQAFDRASPVEYITSTVTTPALPEDVDFKTDNAIVTSLPVNSEIKHRLSGLYSDNVNHANIRDGHAERLAVWDHKTPERMALVLSGWQAARVSLGDTVTVTTDLMVDREGRDYSERKGLVIQAGADWFGASSRVTILFLPTALVAQPAPGP